MLAKWLIRILPDFISVFQLNTEIF